MKAALLLLLALLPGSAFAVEAAVVSAITSFFSTVAVLGVTYGQIAFMIGATLYGNAQQKKAKAALAARAAAAQAAAIASLQDRTVTNVTTEQYYRTIYGKDMVGGNVVAIFSSGDNDEFKHLVVEMAAHEITAYHEIYIADKLVGDLNNDGWVYNGVYYNGTTETISELMYQVDTWTLPSNYVPGSVSIHRAGSGYTVPVGDFTISGTLVTINPSEYSDIYNYIISYNYIGSLSRTSTFVTGGFIDSLDPTSVSKSNSNSKLNIQKHLGTPGEPADAYLRSVLPTKWTADHTLPGHAYLVVTLNLTQPEFQNGVPSVKALISGKKLYDPRTGVTAWSDNPALVILDYLRGPYIGVPDVSIPMSDYSAAANDCDDMVGTPTRKRYTFNGMVTAGEAPKKILELMADAMAGTLDATTWSIYAGKYRAPVVALQQDAIVGSLAVNAGPGLVDVYNLVRGRYSSPANQYVPTDYTPYTNAAYRSADGEELAIDVDYPYTNNVQGVHDLARISMEDTRNALSITADFSYAAWRLRPGDRLTLTLPLFGMTNKVFRVLDKSYKVGEPIKLALKEDDPTIWDQADAIVEDETPNTGLPDPFSIPLVQGLAAESGEAVLLVLGSGDIVSRLKVSWQQTSYLGASFVEVQAKKTVTNTWESVTMAMSNGSTYFSGVQDGESYTIRARVFNATLGISGDWSYLTHTIIGKSSPPPDVPTLTIYGTTLAWTPVSVLDLRGYQVRFHVGNNINWASATPMHSGFLTETPYSMTTMPTGPVTILIKAVATSGNESVNPTYIITDLGDAALANVLVTFDLDALGYPGTITGGSISGGDIVATYLDSFYGPDNDSFYHSDTGGGSTIGDNYPFYDPTSWSEVVYTTLGYVPSAILAGSNATLLLTTEGAATTTIEYRIIGPVSFFGLDAASFYGPSNSDSFYRASNDPTYADATPWAPWPGQIPATADVYQFRVTLTPSTVQPKITYMAFVIDAPDIEEQVNDLPISASGTIIPLTRNFTKVVNIQATLQANLSVGETVEIDKISRLVKVYNSSHVAVSGATVDLTVKGY